MNPLPRMPMRKSFRWGRGAWMFRSMSLLDLSVQFVMAVVVLNYLALHDERTQRRGGPMRIGLVIIAVARLTGDFLAREKTVRVLFQERNDFEFLSRHRIT